jgi:hypothetical protein
VKRAPRTKVEESYHILPAVPNVPVQPFENPTTECLFVGLPVTPAAKVNQLDVFHEFRRSVMSALAIASVNDSVKVQPVWYGEWNDEAHRASGLPFLKLCSQPWLRGHVNDAMRKTGGQTEKIAEFLRDRSTWNDAPKFAFIEPALSFPVLLERAFVAWQVLKHGGFVFFLLTDKTSEALPFFRWVDRLGLTDDEWGRLWGFAHHPLKRYDNSVYMLWPYADYLELPVDEAMITDRQYDIGFVGYVHARAAKMRKFLCSDGTYKSVVWGVMDSNMSDELRSLGAEFLGPVGTLNVVERCYRQCRGTPAILPTEYDELGLLTARMFESLYAGCLPFVEPMLAAHFPTLFVNEVRGVVSAEDCVVRLRRMSNAQRLELVLEQRKRFKTSWNYLQYGKALHDTITSLLSGKRPDREQRDGECIKWTNYISRSSGWKIRKFKKKPEEVDDDKEE